MHRLNNIIQTKVEYIAKCTSQINDDRDRMIFQKTLL